MAFLIDWTGFNFVCFFNLLFNGNWLWLSLNKEVRHILSCSPVTPLCYLVSRKRICCCSTTALPLFFSSSGNKWRMKCILYRWIFMCILLVSIYFLGWFSLNNFSFIFMFIILISRLKYYFDLFLGAFYWTQTNTGKGGQSFPYYFCCRK